MLGNRTLLAAGLVILLRASTTGAAEPRELLEKSGLTLSKRFFVIESEQPILQKISNLAPIANAMENRFANWAAILQNEQNLNDWKDQVTRLQAVVNDYQRQLARMPARTPFDRFQKEQVAQERDQYAEQLRLAITNRELCKNRLVSPKEKNQARADYLDRLQVFVSAKDEIEPMIDKLQAEYDQLKANSSVTNALQAYNRAAKVSFKIGPSDELARPWKKIVSLERQYSPETAPRPVPRKSRGQGSRMTAGKKSMR